MGITKKQINTCLLFFFFSITISSRWIKGVHKAKPLFGQQTLINSRTLTQKHEQGTQCAVSIKHIPIFRHLRHLSHWTQVQSGSFTSGTSNLPGIECINKKRAINETSNTNALEPNNTYGSSGRGGTGTAEFCICCCCRCFCCCNSLQ